MVVCMGKYPVHSPTNRPQFCHWWFLNINPRINNNTFKIILHKYDILLIDLLFIFNFKYKNKNNDMYTYIL